MFFDNLQVTHTRGPLLEEAHYYPFGLTMAGISSKSLGFGNPVNNKKYNGIEKENDLQIEIYDAQLRDLDAQVARWWQIDPKTEDMEMWSPFASNYDNPVIYADPMGNAPDGCCGDFVELVDEVLISASGVAGGVVNLLSGGIFSSDPLNFRSKLSEEQLATYDRGVLVGKVGLLASSMKSPQSGQSSSPYQLVTVNGQVQTLPTTLVPTMPTLVPFAGGAQRSESDQKLIKEAQEAKLKEEAAKMRQQKRDAATSTGKSKVGNSNKEVAGSHSSGSKTKGKRGDHQQANARRAAEQEAAAAKKAAEKAAAEAKKAAEAAAKKAAEAAAKKAAQ